MLTLDLETAPQLRYVEPEGWEDWAGREWADMALKGAHLFPEVNYLADEIRAGRAPVEATGVAPALHPVTSHIVAASFGGLSKEPATGNLFPKVDVLTLRDFGTSDDYAELLAGGAEVKLIQTCLDRVAWCMDGRRPLVSFNGKMFDLWVLRTRAMLVGIDPEASRNQRGPIPWGDLRYPYGSRDHCDLRMELGDFDRRARGTLKWWCDAFGIESQESGGEVWEWVREGKWSQLAAYGQVEGKTLLELWERVKPWT
jgi:hypothetical protein